ncbi:MAG: alkaline phosphatase D family protein, partial [Pseudonocardia sp.]
MTQLVLGPMVRFVDEHSAAIWVETDGPCTVEVLDTSTRTFTVHDHHYALVELTDLPTGASLPYTVALDGEQVWPGPGSEAPPSRIRTLDPQARTRLLFGSCRTSVPHDIRHTLTHGVDVLRCYSRRLRESDESEWPTTLLLLGDQVYADEPPEVIREFIRNRRDTSEPPGEEIADFAEYAELYRLAWIDPDIRWLL